MIEFLKTIIYVPLYNLFVLILNIDFIDAGVAAVALTVLVKLVLYPLSKKSIITQIKMREKEGDLKNIKEKYKDRQEQALKVMEFYKQNNINPFSGILGIIIQIPVVFSLYYVFFKSGLPMIDEGLLYSFIKVPEGVSMMFLGILDVSQKSLILAFLAALSTFLQMHFSTASLGSKTSVGEPKEDFSKMMANQMKYTMPVVVFVISWQISGVVALYWFVSNLLGIAQDFYIKRQLRVA